MNKQPIYKCRVCGFESNYNLPREEMKFFNELEVVTQASLGCDGLSTDKEYCSVCPDCGIVYRYIEKLRVKE